MLVKNIAYGNTKSAIHNHFVTRGYYAPDNNPDNPFYEQALGGGYLLLTVEELNDIQVDFDKDLGISAQEIFVSIHESYARREFLEKDLGFQYANLPHVRYIIAWGCVHCPSASVVEYYKKNARTEQDFLVAVVDDPEVFIRERLEKQKQASKKKNKKKQDNDSLLMENSKKLYDWLKKYSYLDKEWDFSLVNIECYPPETFSTLLRYGGEDFGKELRESRKKAIERAEDQKRLLEDMERL